MLAELVFMTRFLGLASGQNEVTLRATPDVRRVEIRRDADTIESMAAPPWRTKIDLGAELGPYELTAVGFGADGTEIARDTQLVNLARPLAEAGILLERSGQVLSARVLSTHALGRKPSAVVLKLDGKMVSRSSNTAPVVLFKIRDNAIHVVSAELEFADGSVARKEIAFGGIYSEEVPAELTPIPVRQRDQRAPGEARCLQVRGNAVAPVVVERGDAVASFVVNGDTPYGLMRGNELRYALHNTRIRVVSPVLRATGGGETFPGAVYPGARGTLAVLASRQPQAGIQRFAHAVATAAMDALRGQHRRAVVYVLGHEEMRDESGLSPAAVRRYLQRIGVPLRVWSYTGPRLDLEAAWGPVQDVSSAPKLIEATEELREELATQRIAWVAAPPLDAYRARATEDCAYVPLTAITLAK